MNRKFKGLKVNLKPKMLAAVLLSGSVLLSGGQAVAAADVEPDFDLNEVIVTATRTVKAVKEVPASVDVITAEEIAARNVTSVTEALQMKASVYMSPVAQGGISLRGFSSTDILVLVDGQPMNSGWNGVMNWEMVPVERIARIEIVRGAASSLYGGRAVGGVINIVTKDNTKDSTGEAVVSYGSNNTWKKSFYLDQKLNEKLSVGAGYESRSSDGFRGFYRTGTSTATGTAIADVNLPKLSNGSYVVGGRGEKDWDNENKSFNFNYKFDQDKSLKYTYMKSENDYSYRNPFSYTYDAAGNPIFNGTVRTQDGRYVKLTPGNFLGYVGKRETELNTVNYRDDANKIQLNLGFSNTTKDGYSSPTSPTSVDWQGAGTNSFYPSKAYNFDFQKSWDDGNKHTVVAGINGKQESFDQIRYRLSNWTDHHSATEYYEKHGGKAENLALFVQDEYKLSEPVTVYTGVRYDRYKKYDGYSYFYDSGEVLNMTKSKNHRSGSYEEISPKVAVEFKADEKTTYYTSYGHSFNPPILYQVYRYGGGGMGDVIANPDLDPETSDTFEIGIKKSLTEKTNLGVTVYHVKTDDKVAYITHPDFKRYENAGQEKRKGIELDVHHTFDSNWKGYLNYAWQQGKITNSAGSESSNYEIPRHLLHSGVEYAKNKVNVLLDAQYVSERQAPDSASGEYGAEDAFFIMNVNVNYQLTPSTKLQFGVQNVFDREFYASEATSGRTFTAGVRYQF